MQAETVNIVTGRIAGGATVRQARWGILSPAALPVVVVLAAILVQCFPAVRATLQFDRHAVGDGQVWRMLTCHLTHWSWSHLAADLAAFVTLWWLGRDRPYRLFAMLAVSAAAVGMAVWAFADDITVYRGLSGMNYALLGWVLVTLAAGAGRLTRITCISLLAIIAAKIAFEVAGTGIIPGIGLPEGIATVGAAHAAGLIVGTLAGNKTRNQINRIRSLLKDLSGDVGSHSVAEFRASHQARSCADHPEKRRYPHHKGNGNGYTQ